MSFEIETGDFEIEIGDFEIEIDYFEIEIDYFQIEIDYFEFEIDHFEVEIDYFEVEIDYFEIDQFVIDWFDYFLFAIWLFGFETKSEPDILSYSRCWQGEQFSVYKEKKIFSLMRKSATRWRSVPKAFFCLLFLPCF